MDPLITRLKQQTEDFDMSNISPPDSHLPKVLRRGKRYLVAASTATILGVTATVAVAAVAVPQIVERVRGPQQLTVVSTPDGAEEPSVDKPTEEPVDKPVEEAAEKPNTEPADVTAPDLVVLKPSAGATVDDKNVTFSGETEPGATVAAGPYTATVNNDGSWSVMLIASSGKNNVTFNATDAAGNKTTKTITVTYNPPTTEKPKEQTPDGTLTASQQSSKLTASPYKNLYSGTAAPGEKVAIVSDYGTAYVWAGDDGSWSKDVEFNPPAGTKTFTVTVKLYNQQNVAKTFQLTTVKDSQTVKVFTANQTKSNLAAEPHTNTYAGTANPGEKIKVLSDYGWAYGWADESGNWQVEVDFNPPAGTKTFNVTARYYNDTSVSKTFQLTTVAPAAAQFTATQKFASVSVTGPTNTLFGEGEPGHEVWLWSDGHGETSVTVGADGTWQGSLTYTNVKVGDTFATKARDTTGGTSIYFEVTITE